MTLGTRPSGEGKSSMGMRKGYLYSLIPLALLAADLVLFPVLQNRIAMERVDIRGLLNHRIYSIGRYRLHPIQLSVGRIDDPTYVSRLGGVDAIAITAFSQTPDSLLGVGLFGQTLLRLLPSEDAAAIVERLKHSENFSP